MAVTVEMYILSEHHWNLINEVTMFIQQSGPNVVKKKRKILGTTHEINKLIFVFIFQ